MKGGLNHMKNSYTKSNKLFHVIPLMLALMVLVCNPALAEASKAKLTIWSIPKSASVVNGFSKNLVTLPAKGDLPQDVTFKSSNLKVATVNSVGTITGNSPGTAIITAKASSGKGSSCKVTVVKNTFNRTYPLTQTGTKGIFSSTKRLYYSGGALKVEMFIHNCCSSAVTGVSSLTFKLLQSGTVLYSEEIHKLKFTTLWKYNTYKVYSLTITEEMLPGVSKKVFDLTKGNIQGKLSGTMIDGRVITPLTYLCKG